MTPPLSVVIAVWTGSAQVLKCLESLESLPERRTLEVVLGNTCHPETMRDVTARFPDVCVVQAPAGSSIAQSRQAAIERCTAPVIAVLHERYSVHDRWARAIIEAHKAGIEAACGAVAPGPKLSLSQWAMYLSEYSHIAPPLAPAVLGPGDEVRIAGGNVSYHRSLLEKNSMANSLWELDYHAGLLRQGTQVHLISGRDARFGQPFSLREYIAERFRVSRDFAALRSRSMGRAGAIASAFARVALPVLLTARIASRILRGRGLGGAFLKALPWIIFFTLVQTAGEISGLVRRKPLA